jgi:pimeloyl-ACP methyl ester carboxylesterase
LRFLQSTVTTNMADQPAGGEDLFHVEIPPAAASAKDPSNIVFLHGLLSSHLEWALVTPHLASYRIFALDQNGHSGSRHVRPVTVPAMTDNVARFIQRHCPGGTAHVVGLSAGGFVTLDLARRHPSLVQSAFVSGAAPLTGTVAWMVRRPWVCWYVVSLFTRWMPAWLYRWLSARRGMKEHEEVRLAMQRNLTWETVREFYPSILDVHWKEVSQITEVPVLVVAGGLDDDAKASKKAVALMTEAGNKRAKAFVVPEGAHAWDLQFPELFAEAIKAWVEGQDPPAGLEPL